MNDVTLFQPPKTLNYNLAFNVIFFFFGGWGERELNVNYERIEARVSYQGKEFGFLKLDPFIKKKWKIKRQTPSA